MEAGRLAQLAHLVAAASHAGFMGRDGQGPLRALVRELEQICGGE